MFKDRSFVAAKGCFDRLLKPTKVCVNLGEVTNVLTKKRRFYCGRNFPKDCSEFGYPKLMPLNKAWRKDLRKVENYE
ncbi:hypothetical protein ES708_18999 [subsurface metagenome]